MKTPKLKVILLVYTIILLAGCSEKSRDVIVITKDNWMMEDRDPPYTVFEVKERYGEPDSIIKHEYSTELAYTNLGISFTCYSLEPTSKISELVVIPPSKLRTSKGIILNQSTMKEAHEIYGKETWFCTDLIPGYSLCQFDHGITFAVSDDIPFDKEQYLKKPITRIALPYFNLHRNDYKKPDSINILVDDSHDEIPSDSIETFLSRVLVMKIDLDLEEHQDPDWEPLWENFANRPYEKQFSSMTTKDWFNNWDQFQSKLVSAAEAQHLDSENLRTILSSLKPESDSRIAEIPVGAFLATKGNDPVWIVIIKWEHAGMATFDKKEEWMSLGHIKILVFRVSDGECIDGTQCS